MSEPTAETFIDFSDLAFELIAPDDWNQAIKTVLSRIGRRLVANQVDLLILDPQIKKFESKNTWSQEANSIKKIDINSSQIPWIEDQMWQSNLVVIPDTKQIDEHIPNSDHNWIKQFQVSSLILMPVPVNRALGGIILIQNPSLNLSQLEKVDTQLRSIAQAMGKAYNFFQTTNQQKNLKVDDSFFKQLIQSLDEALLILDQDKKIIGSNIGFSKLFGQDVSIEIGKEILTLENILPENSLQLIDKCVGFAQIGVTERPQELTLVSKSGDILDLEMSVSTFKTESNKLNIVVIWRDITFRKGMQRQSQESESKLRMVLESIKEGITLSDAKGYFEIFNSEMEALCGYSRQEANKSKDFLDLIHSPELKSQALDRLGKVKIGQKLVGETEIKSKTGDIKYVSVSTTLIQNQGKDYYLSAFHDQTTVKLVEEELNKQNQELAKLTQELQEARAGLEEKVKEKTQELQTQVAENEYLAKFPSEDPFPVLRIGFDGKLLYANSASKALLDLWQCSLNQIVPDGWKNLIEEVAHTNTRKIYEIEILGQVISFVLVPVASGDYVNMYGRDVSREKEIDKMKNQFISMVSHQIRTPLTSVRWYSEMLLKGKDQNALNEHQKDLTSTIHETSVSLTELVNDLLSISRMESGKIDYNPSTQDLIPLIQEVIKELQPQAEAKKINLEFIHPDLEPFNFDPKLMLEVYRNLISNAIKYTPDQGRVKIELIQEAGQILTRIIDSGIGIPKAAQENIFQRFYRAQNAVDKEYEGTGLGLSVAKMIVEKSGGKIWFESEESKGTTFFFTLPLENMI